MLLRMLTVRSHFFDIPCSSSTLLLVRHCTTASSQFRAAQTLDVPKSSREGTTLNLDAKRATNEKRKQKRGKKRIEWSTGTVGMLIIPVVTFCLGCWQVGRLQWKLALIDSMRQRLNAPAIDIPEEDLPQLDQLEYKRVRVRGEFLHDREFVISPRGRFDPGYQPKNTSSIMSNEEITSHGGHVITPFRLQKNGRIIMVNRGWVPPHLISRESRLKSEPKGIVQFEAIVRKTEKRPQFVSKNAPEMGLWYYKDLEEMGQYYGTEPVMVDAVYETSIPGGPIGGQTNVSIRNEHMQYIVTW
ncbi:hypothetical protein WR25_09677 [Diploscapter pachys]|uniref:SURF1-like protein n=1 Tax=Diploscapter pachys TaxID=2018661 RepID=A0A2A2K877_9BILA|nr:hypothetical protein WR25_09677 [Diploscapter pachys]